MQRYQGAVGHKPYYDRKTKSATFNRAAVQHLESRYPDDPLYKLLATHSKRKKLLGTYIGRTQPNGEVVGGIPVGRDGRVHTLFTHNPSTLRFASQNPNLQNLPRPNPRDPSDISNLIRGMIVAQRGNMLVCDGFFSGIEAVS